MRPAQPHRHDKPRKCNARSADPKPPSRHRGVLLALVMLCVLTALAHPTLAGEDPGDKDVIPHRQDVPPNRPYSPQEAIERMEVPEGFTVELVAAEPDIVNPVAMAFDDRGRIWITESLEYPRKSPGEGRDRVRILEDRDGDGAADHFQTFVDDLNIPSGIAVGHGGVWVLNAPDLLFFREEDGKPISRDVIVTGFGRTDTHELPSSLTWGPDGWLYGLNGVFNRSRIESGDRTYAFTCALYRIHPRSHEFHIVSEGTSNPWGLIWSPDGSAIVSACHWAKDHIFHFVETGYYQRQAGPYPAHTWKLGAVSDHGHQKTAFCGLAYFDSPAYPAAYRDRLYFGNVHGNCINVDRLERRGATYVSREEPDFLTAHDAWFMPVSQKLGPDGSLYILDWYDRYHCYQDANRDPGGIDRARGRLYRVRYGDTPRTGRFDLASETDARLLERLDSPNLFFRQRAQRLLVERMRPELRRELERFVWDTQRTRKGRLHAVWSLVGSGALEADFHRRLLDHPDAAFRAWAVRAAGEIGSVGAPLRNAVAALAFDASPRVQLQVAIAAPKLPQIETVPVLVNVLASCGEDPLVPAIVWQNLHPELADRGEVFARQLDLADTTSSSASALRRVLPRVLERLLAAPEIDVESAGVVLAHALAPSTPASLRREALAILAARLPHVDASTRQQLAVRFEPLLLRSPNPSAAESPRDADASSARLAERLVASQLGLAELDLDAARRAIGDPDTSSVLKLQALEALRITEEREAVRALETILDSGDKALIEAAFKQLGRFESRQVAVLVLDRFESLERDLKSLAVEVLLERKRWARELLDRVIAGRLPRSVLQTQHLLRILEGNDREAIWAIEKHWGEIRTRRDPDRQAVVERMTRFLRETPGSPEAGRRVFDKLCSSCHTLWGHGQAVGPDLTTNGRASFDQLVSNVFDPNLVIGPGLETTLVITRDGRVLTGLIEEDSEQRITLKLTGGRTETVPRAEVRYTRKAELSLMPESIEETLESGEIADLFAYLALDGPPGDPPPRAIPGAPDWVQERARGEAAEAERTADEGE